MSKLGESCMNKKSKKAHAYEEREKSACEWRQRIVRPCIILLSPNLTLFSQNKHENIYKFSHITERIKAVVRPYAFFYFYCIHTALSSQLYEDYTSVCNSQLEFAPQTRLHMAFAAIRGSIANKAGFQKYCEPA